MTISELLWQPFADHAFMRRALVLCCVLGLGGSPLGHFMILRRMTLAGDAMSHTILPGVALAFAVYGLAFWPMVAGGLAAAVLLALVAAGLTRFTRLREDSSFTMIYLLAVASGSLLATAQGSNDELIHMLLGDVLAAGNQTLILAGGVTCATLLALAVFYRSFVLACFDPDFAQASHSLRQGTNLVFYGLLAVNLVTAFQALGTLLALGLMILPALTARFWTQNIDTALPVGVAVSILASFTGLLLSYHARLQAGPAVVLMAGLFCVASLLLEGWRNIRESRQG